MTNTKKMDEALANAIGNKSTANFGPIIHGFLEKGIPLDDIRPRENVFTFWAWKALGRRVRKGEHGVKVITWVPMEPSKAQMAADMAARERGETVKARNHTRPWTTTVFHISQTEADPYAKPTEPAAA